MAVDRARGGWSSGSGNCRRGAEPFLREHLLRDSGSSFEPLRNFAKLGWNHADRDAQHKHRDSMRSAKGAAGTFRRIRGGFAPHSVLREFIKSLILLVSGGLLTAQSGLNRPALGQMIDRQNLLRPVSGVGGSFQAEDPTAEGVLATACAGTICLAKTESALISWNAAAGAVTPAPPGAAEIAVDTTGATIYFPSIQQFGRWQNGVLTTLSLSVYGTVLSLNSGSSGLTIAVQRSGIVWIVTSDGTIPDGTVLGSLPHTAGAVLLIPNEVVYATPGALILRKPDGSELSFPAPAVTALFALGDGYVEAQAGGILYALRTIAGREQLFQLPQPAPLRQTERRP